jgi:GxxExxY protein
MTVHRALGSGFQEVIYQRAPVIEMERAGIDSGRGIEQHIYYLRVKIGSKPVDIIMANRVVVQLKGPISLHDVHQAQ